jgi:16S rRNA (uracil1498-N3)-methyltransferase
VSDPVFHAELPDPLPAPGATVVLDGPEGRHAAVVRRIRPGETVVLADGCGRAIHGPVVAVEKQRVTVEVTEQRQEDRPAVRLVVAQALAKGDRGELAVELLTEVGVSEIVPWQSSRSIVRWSGERGAKGLSRWRSTAREAAKQSRRLWTPTVAEPVDSAGLAARVAAAELALLLHEDATAGLADVVLPAAGEVLLVVGPEGGISPEELATLCDAGGRPTVLTPHVLRTSTAGLVACAGLLLRPAGDGPSTVATWSEPVEDHPSTTATRSEPVEDHPSTTATRSEPVEDHPSTTATRSEPVEDRPSTGSGHVP